MPGLSRLAQVARRRVGLAYGKAFRRKTVFHATPTERVPSIMRQGLREGMPETWTRAFRESSPGYRRPPGIFVGDLATAEGMRPMGALTEMAQGRVEKPTVLLRARVHRSRVKVDPDWDEGRASGAFIVRGRIPPRHLRQTSASREYLKQGVAVAAGGLSLYAGGKALKKKHKERRR